MKIVLSLIITSALLGGCENNVIRIDNPEFTKIEEKYKNVYLSAFEGNGPHHQYDNVDFLKPEEKRDVEPSLIGFAYSGIDKTHGFSYDSLLHPNIDIKEQDQGRITWLGHASFLIQQTNGDALVTDPVFEEFDGYGWLGSKLDDSLKRLGEAPIQSEQLSFVSGVMVSHNHYDHLNNDSLNRFSKNTRLYLPLDNADDVSFTQGPVVEMDWYTQTQHKDTTIHFLPANHVSNQGLFDFAESLWGSWLLQDGNYSVYFAGDTGYSPIFKDIHKEFGNIDVCLMPIVAYPSDARWMHLAPEDAIKAAQDLGCRVFIPWGYGTWSLGYEHVNEPLRRLAKAVEDINPNFIVKPLKMGESLDYVELLKNSRIASN
jgi:L-ascorbate metabolism protein UlaG (beta-lactamase superfamily)